MRDPLGRISLVDPLEVYVPAEDPLKRVRLPALKGNGDNFTKGPDGRFTGSTPAGGSSSGSEGTGRLDPESSGVAAAARDLRAEAEAAEPQITADMQAIAEVSGGRLEGLDFRLKSESSLARKLATDPDYVAKEMTLEERSAAVKDSVRYTQILTPENYADGVRESLDEAHNLGYETTTSNAWSRPDGYAGFHATLSKEGQPRVELQFHTAESFKAKEFGDPEHGVPASHVIYEKLRVETNPSTRASLERQVAALWAPVRASMGNFTLGLP